jgi:hypothetical protein
MTPRRHPNGERCSEYSACLRGRGLGNLGVRRAVSRSLADEGRAQAGRAVDFRVVNVEKRAHVGRGVGGEGGSAVSKDQNDDDGEQARDREQARARGSKHHNQRCVVTYDARRDREPPRVGADPWASRCVSERACKGGSFRRFRAARAGFSFPLRHISTMHEYVAFGPIHSAARAGSCSAMEARARGEHAVSPPCKRRTGARRGPHGPGGRDGQREGRL